jgi:hypothetical protein
MQHIEHASKLKLLSHPPRTPSTRNNDLALSHLLEMIALRIASKSFLDQSREGIQPQIAKLIQFVEGSRTADEDFC